MLRLALSLWTRKAPSRTGRWSGRCMIRSTNCWSLTTRSFYWKACCHLWVVSVTWVNWWRVKCWMYPGPHYRKTGKAYFSLKTCFFWGMMTMLNSVYQLHTHLWVVRTILWRYDCVGNYVLFKYYWRKKPRFIFSLKKCPKSFHITFCSIKMPKSSKEVKEM